MPQQGFELVTVPCQCLPVPIEELKVHGVNPSSLCGPLEMARNNI